MKKIKLGKSALEIAPLIFGGNVFGWTIDEARSFELLNEFHANGYNCIDTADVYSFWGEGNTGGESERIIGKWMKQKGNRDKIIVATKAGYGFPGKKNSLKKDYLIKSVETSLKHLQTDYIDLFQTHVDDPDTPIEETLSTLTALQQAGKIRYIGCSNFTAQRIEESLNVSAQKNLAAYISVQPEYNLYDREGYEKNLQGVCVKNELAVIPYFPLAAGFLTGKYKSEADAANTVRGARAKKYFNERGFRIIAALEKVAKEYNASPAEIALAWIRKQAGIAAPIASSTNPQQLHSLMKSAEINLRAESLAKLNQAS